MFYMHNTRGASTRLICGLHTVAKGILFTDDGFGNLISVNPVQTFYSLFQA